MKKTCFSLIVLTLIAMCSACSHRADEPIPEPDLPDEPIVMPDDPYVTWEEDTPMNNGSHYGGFSTLMPPDVAPIDGLTVENFPIIDGSDSTQPLRELLAIALTVKYKCLWMPWVTDGSMRLTVSFTDLTEEQIAIYRILYNKLKINNTHPSYQNLIDGTVDLIICARESSEDEINYANEKGVTLIEKPIALDSFAFLLNRRNSVSNLTHEQIVAIYSGQITQWSQVGGNDSTIIAYTRNRNSGSQEKMEKLVMQGVPMADNPELRGGSMMYPYQSIMAHPNGIAYSPYYYYLNMSDSYDRVRAICVNGIPPTRKYIRSREYPFVSEVYACIRSDEPANSYARKVFDYLTSADGKKIIEASGYTAN